MELGVGVDNREFAVRRLDLRQGAGAEFRPVTLERLTIRFQSGLRKLRGYPFGDASPHRAKAVAAVRDHVELPRRWRVAADRPGRVFI